MADLSVWDVAILVAAAYLSIVTLVRLMRHRRDQVIAGLQSEVAAEQRRQRTLARRERQQQVRAAQSRAPQGTRSTDR